MLCLVVRSIGQAAALEINGDGTGFRPRRQPDAAPPMRLKRSGAGMTAPPKKSGEPLSSDIDASLGVQVVPQILTPLRRSRP